jgi:hypothetical protein
MNFFSTYVLFIQNWLILRFDLIDFYQLNKQMDFLLLQENHIKMILPEVFLATSILVVTLHSSLLTTSRHFGFPLLTQSFSKLCILILLLTFLLVNNNPLMFMLIYQNTFIFDLLTANV